MKGTWSIGRESAQLWLTNSTLTRPLLSKCQWFHDPQWNRAKKLSEGARASASSLKHASGPKSTKKKNVRHYSTSSKSTQKDADSEVC